MLLQSFGYGSILLRCLTSSLCCSAFHDPYWFILSEIRRRLFTTAALGNNRPFCLPSHRRSVLLYLFIPWFRALGLRIEQVLNTFGHPQPRNRLLLHQITIASAPLSSFLHCALCLCLHIFFDHTVLNYLVLGGCKGMVKVLFFMLEAWIMGGETLWRKPCPTINSELCAVLQGAKMESWVC